MNDSIKILNAIETITTEVCTNRQKDEPEPPSENVIGAAFYLLGRFLIDINRIADAMEKQARKDS